MAYLLVAVEKPGYISTPVPETETWWLGTLAATPPLAPSLDRTADVPGETATEGIVMPTPDIASNTTVPSAALRTNVTPLPSCPSGRRLRGA